MNNEQLQELLQQADTLRRDAYLALKSECRSRGIDKAIIDKADAGMVEKKIDQINSNIQSEKKKWWQKVFAYAFEQRYNDAGDDEIMSGIIGMGASADETLYVVENIEKLASAELKVAEADKLAGIIKLVVGLAIIIIAMLANPGNNPFILGGVVAAIGIVQHMNASYRKNRYATIVANCEGKGIPQFPVNDFEGDDVSFDEIT